MKSASRIWNFIRPYLHTGSAQAEYYKRRVSLDLAAPLTFPRAAHIAQYFQSHGITLSPAESRLLSAFTFRDMDSRYSRRQFALLASLFIPFDSNTTPLKRSAILHILDHWGISADQVADVQMSYLNSGDNKSTYKFDVFTFTGRQKAFVIGVDKNTGLFGEKHSKMEFDFLKRNSAGNFDFLPKLLGFTVFRGIVAGKNERYFMITKEYIEGQTAEAYLQNCQEGKKARAANRIGAQLGKFIAHLGGYPNDFHFKNVIVNEPKEGELEVTFNDILGVIAVNTTTAVQSLFLPLLTDEVGDKILPFMEGFLEGAGKEKGLHILTKYFHILMAHPAVLFGEHNELMERFEGFLRENK